MQWMVRGAGPRRDPSQLLPGVRSAVVLGIDYAWARPPDPGGLTGKVARYAWGRDYHNLVSKRMRRLVARLQRELPGIGLYWSCDSRPVLERAWAERAGLAFIGKSAMAIVPGQTSFFFLAVLFVDRALPPSPGIGGMEQHCAGCRRCLDVCPTQALTAAGELDARRCISYLTIEHRGPPDPALAPKVGRWVFGCDDCQEVCPHDHHPPDSPFVDFQPRPGHAWLDLEWVMRSPDEALDAHFVGSPIRRCKPWGLKRNACVALGNIGDPAARAALHRGEAHPHPAVVAAARWGLERL